MLCALVVLSGLLGITLIPDAVAANASVDVRIKQQALVVQERQLLYVLIAVKCDSGGEVLKAILSWKQEMYGEGYYTPVCDGHPHPYLVRVRPYSGVFHIGELGVSVYIIVCEINDNCVTGDPSRTVTVYER